MLNLIAKILKLAVNYVLPHRCLSCSELTSESNKICGTCLPKLNFITKPYCRICGMKFAFTVEEEALCAKCIGSKPKYDIARSLLNFDGHSKKLIYGFKYNDKTGYAKLFAHLTLQRYSPELMDTDIIAPVPMHRFKRLYRYYNPPQLLATELQKQLDKLMIADLLIKTKWTKPQTYLSKNKREKNLAGSIKANTKYNIKQKNILLIDDVHTTGTTANYCSSILKRCGAKSVKLVTVGRT